MSVLLDVLGAHSREIGLAFIENIERAGCPAMVRTQAGSYAAIMEAIRDGGPDGGPDGSPDGSPGACQQWANVFSREAAAYGLSCAEVLTGLSCFEHAARTHVVRAENTKPALLAALAELSDAVDLLRRCYVETQLTAQSGVAPPTQDFAGFAESADIFICLASLHGKPFYLNRAGRRLLGLGENDALAAASLHDFYSDDSWAVLRDEAVPAVRKTGQWEGRSTLRNVTNGKPAPMLTRMFLVRQPPDDKPLSLAVVHLGVGELLRTEAALAESQARKHAILESSLDPIITIDHEGVITEFNRAAEQTFGHARAEVLGTQPSAVLFPSEKIAGHRNRIDRYLDAGEGSLLGRRIEVEAVRANGDTFPAELAMTISQEQGSPVLSFFVRDISKRKKAEEQQARYAADLERSNRELEQFAYVASHDLQEPLRKIRTFSDRLEMQCGDSLDPTGRLCIQRMQSAAARMQTLIEGLLTLSRASTREHNLAKVDLSDVAREVVSDLEVQIEQCGGRVEVDKLPTIQADAMQMRQLLQNLIGNGLKFHRAEAPPVVKVRGQYVNRRGQRQAGEPAAGEQCRIVVEDNGIGFDEKYIDRVFEIFQRLHPRDVYEGTGIGLPICRRIVERHGGTITAHSAPGKGASFEVILPVTQPKKREAK